MTHAPAAHRTGHRVRSAAICVALLAVGATALAAPPAPTPSAAVRGFRDVFAASRDGKHGILLHVHGQTIGGQVVAFDEQIVELRNQSYAHIVVRIDRIDAVSAP